VRPWVPADPSTGWTGWPVWCACVCEMSIVLPPHNQSSQAWFKIHSTGIVDYPDHFPELLLLWPPNFSVMVPVWELMPTYILSIFLLKTYTLFQTQHKWTCEYNTFPWLFKNFWDIHFFSGHFSRPGNNLFFKKYLDFSRFSMTVQTLNTDSLRLFLSTKYFSGSHRLKTQTRRLKQHTHTQQRL